MPHETTETTTDPPAPAAGVVLTEARKAKGWSREALAFHSRVATRTIQEAEHGNNVLVSSLTALADTLELGDAERAVLTRASAWASKEGE